MQPGSAIATPVCGAAVTVPKYGQVPVWIRNTVVSSVPSATDCVPLPPKNSRQLAERTSSGTRFMVTRVGRNDRRVSMCKPVRPWSAVMTMSVDENPYTCSCTPLIRPLTPREVRSKPTLSSGALPNWSTVVSAYMLIR